LGSITDLRLAPESVSISRGVKVTKKTKDWLDLISPVSGKRKLSGMGKSEEGWFILTNLADFKFSDIGLHKSTFALRKCLETVRVVEHRKAKVLLAAKTSDFINSDRLYQCHHSRW